MKRKIGILLLVLLLSCCLACESQQIRVSSSDFIFEVCGNLEVYYWAQAQVNYPKMLNIALQSASETLKSKGIHYSYWPIKDTADVLGAKFQFANEFEKIDIILAEKKIKQEDIIFPVASAICQSFKDSHTYFLEPSIYQVLNNNANAVNFGGIGAEIKCINKDFYYIDRLISGMPAELAGLKRFDIILSIDGHRKFTDFNDLISRLRGGVGSRVKILIKRQQKEIIFELRRADIKPTFYDKKKYINRSNGHQFFYFNLRTFHINGNYSLIDYLSVLGMDGVIIDLRDNHGGYLHICNELLDQFIKAGQALYYVKNTQNTAKCVASDQPKINLPVVVLINENSASASEIFSGVMQEQDKALVVGKKSSGSVNVGVYQELSYGAAMVVTIQQFCTAKGKVLENKGVKPDKEVDLTKEDIENGHDTQLEKALEILEVQLEQKRR